MARYRRESNLSRCKLLRFTYQSCWFIVVLSLTFVVFTETESTSTAHVGNISNTLEMNASRTPYITNTTAAKATRLSSTRSSSSRGETVTITIASVSVAVAILVFVSVLYKFHAKQLDEEALAAQASCNYAGQLFSCSPPHSESQQDALLQNSQTRPGQGQHAPILSDKRFKHAETSTSESQIAPLLRSAKLQSGKHSSRCSSLSSLSDGDDDVFKNPSPQRHVRIIIEDSARKDTCEQI